MKENEVLSILEIRKTISGKVDTVFDALTKPEIMAEWFYGMDEGRAEVESEFKAGGEFVIHMFKADGAPSSCAEYEPHGRYLEIDRPNKVVFTWISEGFVDYSVVTITLKAIGEETELTLRHELPENVVDAHREGWNACLGNLTKNCFS